MIECKILSVLKYKGAFSACSMFSQRIENGHISVLNLNIETVKGHNSGWVFVTFLGGFSGHFFQIF